MLRTFDWKLGVLKKNKQKWKNNQTIPKYWEKKNCGRKLTIFRRIKNGDKIYFLMSPHKGSVCEVAINT